MIIEFEVDDVDKALASAGIHQRVGLGADQSAMGPPVDAVS
jgi:hypothetical protein